MRTALTKGNGPTGISGRENFFRPASHMERSLAENEIRYELGSFADDSGRIFYWNDRVFREIHNVNAWAVYRKFLSSDISRELFAEGLVKTWIPDGIRLPSGGGLLEHRKIDFVSYPPEWTLRMLWDAARLYVRCAGILARGGFALQDCHPWNILFDFCRPTLVDFGSLSNGGIHSLGWIEGLRMFFIQPLWLCKYGRGKGRRIARAMMQEHIQGVGPALVHMHAARFIPPRFHRIAEAYKRAVKSGIGPAILQSLRKLEEYVERLEPPEPPQGYWGNYPQDEEGGGVTQKQQTILDFLTVLHPQSLLDMGTNKGWFALQAESLGCKVVAFDYEEYCVDQLYLAGKTANKRILPLHMDFIYPTPPSGHALALRSSFERLQCDISLVLGMVHHLVLKQGLKFDHIAEIVSRYTLKAAIVEFVPASDPHVVGWEIPPHYSKQNLIKVMAERGLTLEADRFLPDDRRDVLLFVRKRN